MLDSKMLNDGQEELAQKRLSVRRKVGVPNGIIQWSRNKFAICEAVVFDTGKTIVSLDHQTKMTRTY